MLAYLLTYLLTIRASVRAKSPVIFRAKLLGTRGTKSFEA